MFDIVCNEASQLKRDLPEKKLGSINGLSNFGQLADQCLLGFVNTSLYPTSLPVHVKWKLIQCFAQYGHSIARVELYCCPFVITVGARP